LPGLANPLKGPRRKQQMLVFSWRTSVYLQRPTDLEGEGSGETEMRPLARFLLSLFLVLGLQNFSLTAIGLRHVQLSLRDFDVGSRLRHAFSLVRLLTEELGFLHHRRSRQKSTAPHKRAPGQHPEARRNHSPCNGTFNEDDRSGRVPRPGFLTVPACPRGVADCSGGMVRPAQTPRSPKVSSRAKAFRSQAEVLKAKKGRQKRR
jgi:hypothetical protein